MKIVKMNSHLKVIEVLVHCNIVKNDYQADSRVLTTNRLVNC